MFWNAQGSAPQEQIASLKTARVAHAAPGPLDKQVRVAKPVVASLGPAAAKTAESKASPDKTAHKAARATLKQGSLAHWSDLFSQPDASFAADEALQARFDRVVSEAALSPNKVAQVFARQGLAVAKATTGDTPVKSASAVAAPAGKPAGAAVAAALPAHERFGAENASRNGVSGMVLAYADPSPANAAGALASLSSELGLDPLASGEDEEDLAIVPDFEDTPDSSPLPLRRPKLSDNGGREKPDAAAARDADRDTREVSPRRQQKLAYARPDGAEDGDGPGLANKFKNLFNKPRAANGVAVYDISAAKVYMPDGSVLEAHSGIGKMADNPKYAHVKMNGPTPPHTYNLRMREKRFHGVEAIRMLPVDGKNKFGRDGFLTHSYLLRGGRAESHGCVAFKDYKRFLSAFKQGKVKQIVVVPGGGASTFARIAANGRGA